MYDTTELWVQLGRLALQLAIMSLFLMNLRRLLLTVEPQNRAMGANLVWLNLIPLFDFVWSFITVFKIRDSVRNQCRAWGWVHKDNAFPAGLVSVIGYVVSQLGIFLVYVSGPAGLGVFYVVGLAAFVAWIIYWMRTSSLKNDLEHTFLEVSGRGTVVAPVPGGATPAGPRVQGQPVVCRSCGLKAPPGEDFCRSCGARLVAPQVTASAASCPYCGSPYRPGGRFCPACGRPAAEPET